MMLMNLKASPLISFLALPCLGVVYATEGQINQQEAKFSGNIEDVNSRFSASKFKNNITQQNRSEIKTQCHLTLSIRVKA